MAQEPPSDNAKRSVLDAVFGPERSTSERKVLTRDSRRDLP
jgi:hypothetical protein